LSSSLTQQRTKLSSDRLPLALYREVAAHLRQVEGVKTGLLPQQSKTFDYLQSQVGGLWIEVNQELNPQAQTQIQSILDYYAQKYAPWEVIN
jgi:hypothetical protein